MEDVLRMLPLDVVDTNLWKLLRRPCRHSLRQTSRQLLQLSDSLVTRGQHFLLDDSCSDGSPNQDSALGAAHTPVVDRQSAFLVHFPRLSSLWMHGWFEEARLIATLLRYDAAMCRRITSLQLEGQALTIATTCAVRLAMPNLQHLALRLANTDLDEVPDKVQGALFLPLQDSNITEVELSNAVSLGDDVVRSLVGLSRLQHLTLVVSDSFSLDQVQLLSHLVLLQSLRLICFVEWHSLSAVSALFTLTQLTHLETWVQAQPPYPWSPVCAPDEAMGLLGRMSRLQCLRLSFACNLDDAAFGAVLQLTQLTELEVGSLQMAKPSPGHLPHLQRLTLSHSLQPPQLLQSLLPLLPLPSLTALCRDSWGYSHDLRHVSVGICSGAFGDESGDASTVAALQQACRHLAAAPRLHLHTLSAGTYDPMDDMCYPLSFRRVAQGLQPLAGQLTHLVLTDLDGCDEDWGALGGTLPALSKLTLIEVQLWDKSLVEMAEHLPTLQSLRLFKCSGLTDAGWLRLAAACARPLEVYVHPTVSGALVTQCLAAAGAQERSQQTLSFADAAPSDFRFDFS